MPTVETKDLDPMAQRFYKQLCEEINAGAEEYLGDIEMEYLSRNDKVVERLYALESRMVSAFNGGRWKAYLQEMANWKKAYAWIREQIRKEQNESSNFNGKIGERSRGESIQFRTGDNQIHRSN